MDILVLVQQFFRYMTANPNILYVICPFNIGDFLINGGLCHALLKKKRKQACVLIERDRFVNSGLNFVGVMEIRYISQLMMDFIRQYVYVTREYETDNYVYGHFHKKDDGRVWDLIWDENLSFVDRYKENVFGLPLDTELLPPIIAPITDYQKQRLHENYILDKKRTIIIMPYANSTANLEETFWTELVAQLNTRGGGYSLYTNVANSNEKVIQGTSPMMTTFQELVYIADKVNCFIGLRSGIFDLLAFTNARLLYINNSPKSWNSDLNINFNHRNSQAFYIGISELKNVQAFMQQNNLTSADDLIFYGHVKGRDMSFSMDSLIDKIITSVGEGG